MLQHQHFTCVRIHRWFSWQPYDQTLIVTRMHASCVLCRLTFNNISNIPRSPIANSDQCHAKGHYSTVVVVFVVVAVVVVAVVVAVVLVVGCDITITSTA